MHITVVCRSNYRTVKESGYTVKSSKWGTISFRPDETISSAPTSSTPLDYDYVIVTTKTLPPSAKLPLSAFKLSPKTTIVLIQNGIFTEAPYRIAFPNNTIISAVAYIMGQQTSPGEVGVVGQMDMLQLGIYASPSPKAAASSLSTIVAMFAAGGCNAHELSSEAVQGARWNKLMYNGVFNTLCTVTGLDIKRCFNSHKELCIELLREIIAVARLCGAKVDEDAVVQGIASIASVTGFEPSMLQDAKAGRQMEVDAISGNIVRAGEKRGYVPEKLKGLYVALVAMNEQAALGSTGGPGVTTTTGI